jgi:Cu-Zn family superoxide dismutase
VRPSDDVTRRRRRDVCSYIDSSRRLYMNKAVLLIATSAALATGLIATRTADAHGRSATARLATADGVNIGKVEFRTDDGHTEVRVRLVGAPGLDAFHGFHVHANDVSTNGDGCVADPAAAPAMWFTSADGHYNPGGLTHSHHAGDMPVVYVNADGTVETRFRLDAIKPSELDGKVVILHADADNFGNIPVGDGASQYTANTAEATTATSKTGNAGPRIACGVITSR